MDDIANLHLNGRVGESGGHLRLRYWSGVLMVYVLRYSRRCGISGRFPRQSFSFRRTGYLKNRAGSALKPAAHSGCLIRLCQGSIGQRGHGERR
ncbi:hypothetical protein EDC54_10270 [Samsonia erythrinae]|uniref:Uncharacterized protein n=1 Tax=Samsonia erythrinae TaxID=160434 RepID=A0A4R3VLV0_9GAMM|nr:hypothetical protein EDC54_10270 [Samsonia erythrinae]